MSKLCMMSIITEIILNIIIPQTLVIRVINKTDNGIRRCQDSSIVKALPFSSIKAYEINTQRRQDVAMINQRFTQGEVEQDKVWKIINIGKVLQIYQYLGFRQDQPEKENEFVVNYFKNLISIFQVHFQKNIINLNLISNINFQPRFKKQTIGHFFILKRKGNYRLMNEFYDRLMLKIRIKDYKQIPNYRQMEVDFKLAHSTDQFKKQRTVPQVNGNNSELCKLVNTKFEKIINDIKNSSKIQSYINQINIKPQVIIQSFNFIIQSNQRLILNSQDKIINEGTKYYFQTIIQFIDAKDISNLDAKGKAVWYLELQIKLHILVVELFNFKTEHDITNSPKEDYPKVWDKIAIIPPNNLSKIKKQYKALKKTLHMITAAILNEQDHDFSFIKKMIFGFSCSKYMIMNDSSKLQSFVFYRNPVIHLAQKIWNIPENGAIKHLSKITFQGIETNLKMFIPSDGKFNSNVDIFQERPDTITVRLLYKKKIHQYPTQERSGCCTSPLKNIKYIDRIIIHLHGGGFVALSSRSTQNYTRKWANQIGIPIFSVDYRMPPNHPFPQAPEDCLTVYRFLMNHIQHYLNIKPAKVYITGDSAGGNLACVLTGMILKYHGPQVIGGLYLAYPAADLRKVFTHSRLYAITDPLLWPTMLKLCMDSYLKKQQQTYDPFASPVLLSEQFIAGAVGDKRFPLKWPKTIVVVGNKDPLFDDSLVLMQRMVQSNIDCQCTIYDGLSHGFLSTQMFVQQCSKTIDDSIKHLNKLIANQKDKQ